MGFKSSNRYMQLVLVDYLGLGLGQSRQKFFYLPEPQTDFIFAILAEELGFIGGHLLLLLFALLLWRGIRIALGAQIYMEVSLQLELLQWLRFR